MNSSLCAHSSDTKTPATAPAIAEIGPRQCQEALQPRCPRCSTSACAWRPRRPRHSGMRPGKSSERKPTRSCCAVRSLERVVGRGVLWRVEWDSNHLSDMKTQDLQWDYTRTQRAPGRPTPLLSPPKPLDALPHDLGCRPRTQRTTSATCVVMARFPHN